MDDNEPSSPGLLSTSSLEIPAPLSKSSSLSPIPSTTSTSLHSVEQHRFYISPPVLSEAQKELYKMAGDTSLGSTFSGGVDEVIGEYQDGPILYYFARYQGGIANKFASKPFTKNFPELVKAYGRKKAAGTLGDFSPSAGYVHPLSRIRPKVDSAPQGVTRIRFTNVETVDDSSEQGSDPDDYEEDDASPASRRSKRSTRKQALPFSPQKTRSRHIVVPDSDSDEESEERESLQQSTRRSTRIRNAKKANFDLDAHSEPDSEESDDYTVKKSGKNVQKRARVKVSRPAYGLVRDIKELDYEDDDGENAPLRAHRSTCERCQKVQTHKLFHAYSKRSKGKGKRKKTSDDEFEEFDDEGDRITALGGWVRCLKCPVVCHWKCLSAANRDEILKAAKSRDRAEWEHSKDEDGETDVPEPIKRPDLNMNQTTEFICIACLKGGFCMGCMEVALEPDASAEKGPDENSTAATAKVADAESDELLFRCLTCKRLAHWRHLPRPSDISPDDSLSEVASYYAQDWLCGDCASFRYSVDKIIAWRPYPADATDPPRPADEPPHYKTHLPREYLVKWVDRSYRRVQWVPHMWLLSTHPGKLKNFLVDGSKVELRKDLDEEDGADSPITFELDAPSRASSAKPGAKTPPSTHDAVPDAVRRIPPAWITIDRILDLMFWKPVKKKMEAKRKSKRKVNVVHSEDENKDSDEDESDPFKSERASAFDQGEQPNDESMLNLGEWEEEVGHSLTVEDIDSVAWAFIKWDVLVYDESTWDSPPRRSDSAYPAFQRALQRFIDSHDVIIPKRTAAFCAKYDKRAKDEYRNQHVLKDAADLDLGQNPQLKLMPFQVDGFNWLCNNWWIHQHCILADDMGLGKTVQVATFLGYIIDKFEAAPALVVVPNSTITNWVREFERWAPKLRVVPFYGEVKARDIIKKYELKHATKRTGETGAKFHVLVTTYETLMNQKEFTPVFRNQPRWEVLVVDEGQRLKNDTSLLFRRLNELTTVHRVIMTGTPLNNNIRELFNLMNFLDPNEWDDLEALEKEHEELTEELVKQLHNRLRPYFLRRIKSEVLQLPPKNEVIVPVSMAPLQKEIYRSILSHNLDLLKGLTQPSVSKNRTSKGRLNNVLMHLRKCLQHPYLYAEDIEPRGLSPQETHEKMIDASAKLRLLKALLPKLRDRGHRVLLFSQFNIALNVIEDFLNGEGYKYLRLDGNTKNEIRQKGMDEFNKPGSDVFIYLLTTRAGGVGINLFSADTVIIYDPDFNPHQDLQAIARAYRYGQKKTCLVFKLMVKDSAEERIFQVGKKKLVLDHLIVQKMDDENEAGEDVQSILTYGAQALFDASQESKDITYTDQDLEKLVEKTEQEGEQQEQTKEGLSFSFAKIWAADRDSLEDVQDLDQGDSWAKTLQKITLERDTQRNQEVAMSGRGVRRKAAALTKPNAYRDDPMKESPKQKGVTHSDESAYSGSHVDSASENESDKSQGDPEEAIFEPQVSKKGRVSSGAFERDASPDLQYCGLCARTHGTGPGECIMTDKSQNLAEFRNILILHADDEPWEQRIAAIEAIDRTLNRRGHLPLIAGQPLHPIRKLPNNHTQNGDGKPTAKPAASGSGSGPADPSHAGAQSNANPLKRPGSPSTQKLPKVKRPKLTGPLCRMCGQTFHLVKDCSVVHEGPQSIEREIVRLENDPDPQVVTIVHALRKFLRKQRKKESATSQDVIAISD